MYYQQPSINHHGKGLYLLGTWCEGFFTKITPPKVGAEISKNMRHDWTAPLYVSLMSKKSAFLCIFLRFGLQPVLQSNLPK